MGILWWRAVNSQSYRPELNDYLSEMERDEVGHTVASVLLYVIHYATT